MSYICINSKHIGWLGQVQRFSACIGVEGEEPTMNLYLTDLALAALELTGNMWELADEMLGLGSE